MVVSLFFSFKNEFFLFPINQIKRAVYFGVITGLTAWVGIVFSKLIATDINQGKHRLTLSDF